MNKRLLFPHCHTLSAVSVAARSSLVLRSSAWRQRHHRHTERRKMSQPTSSSDTIRAPWRESSPREHGKSYSQGKIFQRGVRLRTYLKNKFRRTREGATTLRGTCHRDCPNLSAAALGATPVCCRHAVLSHIIVGSEQRIFPFVRGAHLDLLRDAVSCLELLVPVRQLLRLQLYLPRQGLYVCLCDFQLIFLGLEHASQKCPQVGHFFLDEARLRGMHAVRRQFHRPQRRKRSSASLRTVCKHQFSEEQLALFHQFVSKHYVKIIGIDHTANPFEHPPTLNDQIAHQA